MAVVRVLHVVGRMRRAGLETFIMNVYRNVDREKIQFDFLTHYTEEGDYDEEINVLGGDIYRMSVMEDKNIIVYIKELNQFFKENASNYNIIHGHWATLGFIYMFLAKKYGINNRISHAHSASTVPGIKGFLISNFIRPMKHLTNYHFACSRKAAKWLYGENNKFVKDVKIIKNGIETERFTYKPDIRKKYRNELGLEDKFVIGHIGSFEYSKNHDFLIDLFKEVKKTNNKSIMVLVGTGKEEVRIKEKVKDLGMESDIKFLGVRTDIPELLNAIDVFVFPSVFEALGIVTIESQASGLPTIVSQAIPDEAYITNLIEPLSLDAPIEKWVLKILSYETIERKNTKNEIVSSGYDILSEATFLEEFYLKINNRVLPPDKIID